MFIFNKYQIFGKNKRDNFAFWVKIAHFIIETNGKWNFLIRKSLPLLPTTRETKVLFKGFIYGQFFLRGFIYVYLAYSYQRVCCLKGEGGVHM